MGSGWDDIILILALSFLIFKHILFKKLNGMGLTEMIKFLNSFILYLIFVYLIILKLLYFIKNKNTINFYKLFIKNILTIIIIYIKI